MDLKNKRYLAIGLVLLVTFSILPVFMAKGIGAVTYTGYVRDRNGRAISNAKVTLYSKMVFNHLLTTRIAMDIIVWGILPQLVPT